MEKYKIIIKDLEENKILIDKETNGILGAFLTEEEDESTQMFATHCSNFGVLSLIKSVENICKTAKKKLLENSLGSEIANILKEIAKYDEEE